MGVKSGTYCSLEYTWCTIRPGFNTVLYVLNLVASSGLFDTKLIMEGHKKGQMSQNLGKIWNKLIPSLIGPNGCLESPKKSQA